MKAQILLLFITIPVFLSNVAGVNKKFKYEGYIINAEGEKINGHVILKSNLTYDEVKIKFINYKGKKSTYKAKNIKGFGYRSIKNNEAGNRSWMWSHYESKKVDEAPVPFGPKNVFMERITEGEVVLFQYWIQQNTNIDNPYKRYFYVQRGDETVKLTNKNFIEEGRAFFSDNEDIVANLGKVNHRFRHTKKVVKKYNDWKARQATSNL